MNQEELLHMMALKLMPGMGSITIQNLISYCKSPSRVFRIPRGKLLQVPAVGPKVLDGMQHTDAFRVAEQELRYCEDHNIRILSYLDYGYPSLLKQIPDLPILLFVRGTLDLNSIPWVAVVGTRTPDDYGRSQTIRITESLSRSGTGILSGLAFGIDQEAHRTCLHEQGTTAAVLGHGLDRVYPWHHRSLADKIVESGGALITEYISGTKPEAVHFPSRNRIVAGMSRAILVMQAANTGGALITAKLGFDYDRDVFAIPGDLGRRASEGCNQLIKDQIASVLSHPQQILDILSIQEAKGHPAAITAKMQAAGVSISVEEKKVMRMLESGSVSFDILAEKCDHPIVYFNTLLLTMELKGIIRMLPGRMVCLNIS
jgi:DNA processing protein